MACCAFGLFLLSQILLPFRRVRTFLFGAELEQPNLTVAWSPFDAPTPAPTVARPRLARRMVMGLVATELVMFAAGGWALVTHGEHWVAEAHAAVFGPSLDDVLCRVDADGNPVAVALAAPPPD